MKYTTTRTQIAPNVFFSHGDSLAINKKTKHVDAIIAALTVGSRCRGFISKATEEQIREFCK